MLLYNLFIFLLKPLSYFASLLNEKARLFVRGRRNLIQRIASEIGPDDSVVWVHCASLGEFEQGRPLMEIIKSQFPAHKILLTFFSPSGYEVRKDYSGADFIYYLPLDTPSNARRFITAVHPRLAIFVKYEFWMNYSRELKDKKIPLVSISAIFRDGQVFFKPYGNLFRKTLRNFDRFFVQNQKSKDLLASIGISAVTLAGDTRFDRVHQVINQTVDLPIADAFKADQKLMVVGSCWPEDLEVLAPFINENRNHLKFIIAPHELTESFFQEIENSLQVNTLRYSQAASKSNLEDYNVLIVDNIGLLSRLYKYGEYAFVGGAYGKGLHNILEAACYGIPIFFGNKNYEKFQEATELIMRGGAFEVSDYSDLRAKYEMVNIPENFLLACEVTKSYVEENLGATKKIMDYCTQFLK